MKELLDRLNSIVKENTDIDALLVSSMINILYTSSFQGESEYSHEAYVLITAGQCTFFTYPMYEEKAKDLLPSEIKLIVVKEKSDFYENISKICKAGARLGFEAENLTYHRFSKIKDNLPGLQLVPTVGIIEKIREIKQANELEKIKKAANITDLALQEVLPQIKVGLKEVELAEIIEEALERLGAQGRAFEIIIASANNSSHPHYKPSDQPIKQGPLLIDMGSKFKNYNSDLSRTFFIGDPNKKNLKSVYKKFEETYRLVLKAQEQAIKAAKPGVKLEKVWNAAYDTFADAKQEAYFIHGLGHGVGLEIHENPSLRKKDETEKKALETDRLKENMIITVEPGLYYPEWGGVRIEDLCLIKADGIESLSKFPKDIKIIK